MSITCRCPSRVPCRHVRRPGQPSRNCIVSTGNARRPCAAASRAAHLMRLVGPRGLARRGRVAGWGGCPARGAAAAPLVEASRLRRFVLALALSALAAPAFASGIGLRWGSCEGASNRNFACDENNGTDVLVASFSPPGGVGALSGGAAWGPISAAHAPVPARGVAAWGHISAAQGSVPPWWQLSSADGCRGSSLAASFLFFGETESDDPWNGQGMGGIAYVRADGQGMGFLVAVAVSASLVQPVAAGRTYSAFKLIINHDQSTGAGSCAGCQTP